MTELKLLTVFDGLSGKMLCFRPGSAEGICNLVRSVLDCVLGK